MANRVFAFVAAFLALVLVLLIVIGSSSKATILPWISAAPEPIQTLSDMYGSRLDTATAEARGDVGILVVTLGSGEPTGTEPFSALSSLVRVVPARREYQLTFHVPRTGEVNIISYIWRPATRKLELSRGDYSGSLGTLFPSGFVSDVDTETLAAIGTGRRLLPAFHD